MFCCIVSDEIGWVSFDLFLTAYILLAFLEQTSYFSFIDNFYNISIKIAVEMFYLNSTLNFGILQAFVFQLEVYYKVDRLLTVQTAQQK